MNELIDNNPDINVIEDEYKRLLGYPHDFKIEGRSRELIDWVENWYKENGKPWVYTCHTDKINILGNKLQINGVEFSSKKLLKQLRDANAGSVMLVAVSAGEELESKAHQFWQDGNPDEYFFMEVYGSAVVEHLVAAAGARFCAWADENSLAVLPHYSPGYPGWDIRDQNKFLNLIQQINSKGLPGNILALETGMLKPKKSLLAIFGITKHLDKVQNLQKLVPCENCSLQNCRYRRKPYKFPCKQIEDVSKLQPNNTEKVKEQDQFKKSPEVISHASILTKNAKYNFSTKALHKWSNDRLHLQILDDKSIKAKFRYEGTTCSNMGLALEFDYHIKLSSMEQGYKIHSLNCQPTPSDVGYTYMCEYIKSPKELMSDIEEEKPLLGKSLDEVLKWKRTFDPEGCYCKRDSRNYKWGLVFEVIHYTLAQHENEKMNSFQLTE